MIKLNVISAISLTKKVLRDMVQVGHGKILFTSSIAAETPGPYLAVYAASKAFLQSFAVALRQEVQDKGIVITALQPGATDTNFFVRADMLDTKVGAAEKDDPAKVAEQAFEALMAGKDHIVAGSIKNKISVAGTKLMSEKQGAKMQAKSTKPGSAPH
jgi:short-subunit dehydrogenase